MMSEYVFEDLIINPKTPNLESLVGKEVYCNNTPLACLAHANEHRGVGILREICEESTNYPFRVETPEGDILGFVCIVPKKEEPKPEYTPFETMKEFVEGYIEAKGGVKTDSFENNLLQCGMWLKERGTESDTYCMVIEMFEEGVFVGQEDTFISEGSISTDFTSWRDLYLGYTFLDGSSCGKLKESK